MSRRADTSRAARVVAYAALCAVGACGGDRCLAYDYAPPSARLQLRDAATGELLCRAADFSVTTDRGAAIPHEDACEWWVPTWLPSGDAGGSDRTELAVSVTGYAPARAAVEITRNDCDEVQPPVLVQVELTPQPLED